MIPKSAGRTPIACSNCAKTKTKCDKKFPCSRCAGRNLRCTLRPTRRSTKGAARIGVPPEGVVAVPPGVHTVTAEPGTQQGNSPSHQQQPPLKPASPKNVMTSSGPEDKQAPLVVDGPPSQFFERPTSGPTPGPTTLSPPMQTPVNGMFQNTPLSGFDDFSRMHGDGSDDGSSPRFMLDWSQMSMPMGYDGMVQPHMLMNPDMPFDPNVMPLGPPPAPSADGMLTIMPDLANGVPSLITPIETPKVERAFSDLELNNGAQFHHQRHISRPSVDSVTGDIGGEMAAIITAQDGWTVFRCTPTMPSTICPKTAKLNLERLEQTLKNHEGWSRWSPQWDEADFAGGDHLTVMHLHESTRDKLLAIMQSFLHKALEIHREGASQHSPSSGHHSPGSSGVSNFVLLPPARVLEYFLRSYANSFERYYPLTSRGVLDANELMHCYNDRAASLLVLMMIAQGAMNIASARG